MIFAVRIKIRLKLMSENLIHIQKASNRYC